MQEPILASAGSAHINGKERKEKRGKKRKGIEAQRVKHPTPPRATDALIGEEEQNGNQSRLKRKQQGAGPQLNYPGPFSRFLQCTGIIR